VSQDAAYDFLSRAARILKLELVNGYHYTDNKLDPAMVDEATYSNLIRCMSGAFHNIAGTLFQAGKHGSTIRFLRHGCTIGSLASALKKRRKARILKDASDTEHGGQKDEDAWKQLEEQLPRRWELLGVCHSKIGDRKVSDIARFLTLLFNIH
jgi:separase